MNELSLSIGAAIGTAAIELLQQSNAHEGQLTSHGLQLIQLMLLGASVVALVIAMFYRLSTTTTSVPTVATATGLKD